MRIRILLFVVLISLPGNIYVLYCHQNPISEEKDEPFLKSAKETETLEDYDCYEDASHWEGTLENIRFWIEGVVLSGLGAVGLIGKQRNHA